MFVEVDSNPNCETSCFARFKEIGPPRPITQVRLYDRNPRGEWCWVTGWTDDPAQPRCPAQAQLVEDSGSGMTHLIFGGVWGIRLKPIAVEEEWDLGSANQWGEPYLSLADAKDIRYVQI
jgi:hypothetical protein